VCVCVCVCVCLQSGNEEHRRNYWRGREEQSSILRQGAYVRKRLT
jgi:hypothetical protein